MSCIWLIGLYIGYINNAYCSEVVGQYFAFTWEAFFVELERSDSEVKQHDGEEKISQASKKGKEINKNSKDLKSSQGENWPLVPSDAEDAFENSKENYVWKLQYSKHAHIKIRWSTCQSFNSAEKVKLISWSIHTIFLLACSHLSEVIWKIWKNLYGTGMRNLIRSYGVLAMQK